MDTPTPPSGAPRRILKPSGTAPAPKRRLVSASGKPIEGKPTTKLQSASGTKSSLLKKPAVKEKKLSPEEEAEQEAKLKAEQEEYERQMEEYNRQMDEYNRQVAEQEAAEAAAAAEKAEEERIAAEKAAAEKAEADRLAAIEAAKKEAEEKAEAERLAAIEAEAAEAARAAKAAEAAAAVAAAKLAAAEMALAAEEAAAKAAAAIAAAEAAGVKTSPAKPSAPAKAIANDAANAAAAPTARKPVLKPASPLASATQIIRKKNAATGAEDGEKAPSTKLLRSAVAEAEAKTESKPPATKLLAAAGKTAPQKTGIEPAKATTKLANSAPAATKLTKAANTTKLAAAMPKAKLGKAKPDEAATKLMSSKKAATNAAVPAPDADDAPVTDDAELADATDVAEEVELSEEELTARDAYIKSLQADASATPIWKKPMFLGASALLLLMGSYAAYYVITTNAENAAYEQNVIETNQLLSQAIQINKAGAETLADVKEKNITLHCSLADAERMMNVIVDPYQKDKTGRPRFGAGNIPEGVAQNAGLLLGIMAEKEPAIETMILKNLEQHADKIKPALFSWMLQRLGVAEVKNINGKLKTLTEKIAAQPKFRNKTKQLAAIWEVMGLRVTEKDVPAILNLLSDEQTDADLVATLAICLDNIIEMTDDAEAKVKMGDQIYSKVPAKYRKKLMTTLAAACSPKALEFYKKRLEERNNWPTEMAFVAYWGNDDLLDYAINLYDTSTDDTRFNPYAKGAISGTFQQSRDRDQATVDKMMTILYDKLDQDSSRWQEIIDQIDPDAGNFIGKDAPEYPKLVEEMAAIEQSRKEKIGLAKTLGAMRSYPWIETILAKLAEDGDRDVAIAAESAQESIKANTAQYAARKAKYERRSGKKK